MATLKRRYTTNDGKTDWIVSLLYNERGLDKAHWFEAQVTAENERTGEALTLPPEIKRYRIGEVENSFHDYVRLDWGGDRDAAIEHFTGTIYRRVYSFIERGH